MRTQIRYMARKASPPIVRLREIEGQYYYAVELDGHPMFKGWRAGEHNKELTIALVEQAFGFECCAVREEVQV